MQRAIDKLDDRTRTAFFDHPVTGCPVVVTWDGVLAAFYADDEDPHAAETEHLIAVELGRLDADARTLDDASRVARRVAGDCWCGWE